MSNPAHLEPPRDDLGQAVARLAREGFPGVYGPALVQAFRHIIYGSQHGVIARPDFEVLDRHLVRIYIAGLDDLSRGYDRRKLENGFSGARGVIARWATPFEVRHLRGQAFDDLCLAHFRSLVTDFETIRLAQTLPSHIRLPPMPTKTERVGCEIIPFPTPFQEPAR